MIYMYGQDTRADSRHGWKVCVTFKLVILFYLFNYLFA